MSNTRRAKFGELLRQERWASSPAFAMPLKANLVAKRCSILKDADAVSLIWFLQFLCLEKGMDQVAREICAAFPDLVGTGEMQRLRVAPEKFYKGEAVISIRRDFPEATMEKFLLKDELSGMEKLCFDDRFETGFAESEANRREAAKRPQGFSGKDFIAVCNAAADQHLAEWLVCFCLDPYTSVDFGPWYFSQIRKALEKYRAQWIESCEKETVSTNVALNLNHAISTACDANEMVLVTGNYGLGASFAARTWCEKYPWRARYVQSPSGSDKESLYRAVARALGSADSLQYRAGKVKEHCEQTLRESGIGLVFDDCDSLLPASNSREALPERLHWIITNFVSIGVPVVLLGSSNFLNRLDFFNGRGNWSVEYFTSQVFQYVPLPEMVDSGDMLKIARRMLPGVAEEDLRGIVAYAKSTKKNLSALNNVVRTAELEAKRAGRALPIKEDFQSALSNWVVPTAKVLASVGNKTKSTLPTGEPRASAAQLLRDRTAKPNLEASERFSEAPKPANRIAFSETVEG